MAERKKSKKKRKSLAIAAGLDSLDDVSAICTKLHVEYRSLSGLDDDAEMDYCYKVKEYDPESGDIGSTLFKATEDSGCCSRQFLGSSRPFALNFSAETDTFLSFVFLMAQRSYVPGFLCCCRPSMSVTDGTGRIIAEVKGSSPFEIRNPAPGSKVAPGAEDDGALLYTVRGVGSQMGISFPCHCLKSCKRWTFDICAPGSDDPVGEISKLWIDSSTEEERYTCVFPPSASTNHKAVIMTVMFLMDIMYFEGKGQID